MTVNNCGMSEVTATNPSKDPDDYVIDNICCEGCNRGTFCGHINPTEQAEVHVAECPLEVD